ncbi:MAG: DUF932 domain-containing protein, partial [Phycisphaerae bacterium]|nr:DUF932 domain-containing protein [Phycisphaerae bacterium]
MPVGQRKAMLPRKIISLTTYAQLDLYLEKFAVGEFGLLLLLGRHGIGKSESVRRALGCSSSDGTNGEPVGSDVLYVEGHMQPYGLYRDLWEHRDQPVVLDDVDKLHADDNGESASDGGTGLYCGEQDMFCFLIDPTGWAEIEGEAFAPGFFLWNSEVGKRSVGVQTFWFQAVCQNHIVWDAVEVVEFSRKHTANVHDSLREIRRLVEGLVEKRDQRRDGFVRVIRKAIETKLGEDTDEVMDVLNKRGITRKLAKEAVEVARQQGGLTIFAVVDALTRIAAKLKNGGD